MTDIVEAKKAVRREARRRMKAETTVADANAVFATIESLDCFANASAVMLYSSLPGELETDEVILRWLSAGKRVFLPRVNDKDLDVVEVEACEGCLIGMRVTEPYGICEPEGVSCDASILDLVIVPALAYDRRCKRLGRGGGFYDRFLSSVDATTIGVVIDGNLYDRLPVEGHDMAVDYVVTPTTIVKNENQQ